MPMTSEEREGAAVPEKALAHAQKHGDRAEELELGLLKYLIAAAGAGVAFVASQIYHPVSDEVTGWLIWAGGAFFVAVAAGFIAIVLLAREHTHFARQYSALSATASNLIQRIKLALQAGPPTEEDKRSVAEARLGIELAPDWLSHARSFCLLLASISIPTGVMLVLWSALVAARIGT